MNLLHITSHLGGGVGKAISGLCVEAASKGVVSRILLLETPEQQTALLHCRANGVDAQVWDRSSQSLEHLLHWADIVVINWWHHPAMEAFLADLPQLPCRLILWCHVNGCHYPYLPYPFAAAFDHILFTSPYCLENSLWSPAQLEWVQAHSTVVYGIGNFDPITVPHKKDHTPHSPFQIGYSGTVNYSKLHPAFVALCTEIHRQAPETHFCMLGEPDPSILNDVLSAGLNDEFDFPGYVTDLPQRLLAMDAFGYPLASGNYATSENAMLEAMAAGLPVVSFDNGPERHILQDGVTGFLAKSESEYVAQMICLSKNPALCERIGQAARSFVIEQYSAQRNTSVFLACCEALLRKEKRTHAFSSILGETPWEWFMFALGEWQSLFAAWAETPTSEAEHQILINCPPILRERRKSSVIHFADTFPEDKRLYALRILLQERKR